MGRPNLNPYIKDEFQDIQYFLNADFHQDMQSGRKFCTFYIYLDDVYFKDSHLQVLERSHTLGAQPYPHYLRKSNIKKDLWYFNDLKNIIEVKKKCNWKRRHCFMLAWSFASWNILQLQ